MQIGLLAFFTCKMMSGKNVESSTEVINQDIHFREGVPRAESTAGVDGTCVISLLTRFWILTLDIEICNGRRQHLLFNIYYMYILIDCIPRCHRPGW